MPVKIIPPTPSAYTYPLLIKHLLHASMVRSPDQEIVYRDLRRRTYREFRERIGRLASGLTRIGVDQGDVVAILEWDSDRYHECYFAIPMMGAVMQTVNVSLVPEDIAYTIIDSGASTVLFNADFLPLVEKLRPHLKAVKNYVLMHDRPEPPQTDFPIKCEYEALLSLGTQYFPFPDFDENACATMFHTTGTTGRPKGVYFTHRQMVLHTLAGLVEYGLPPTPRPLPSRRRLYADDTDVPRPCLGLPLHGHALGLQDGVRRALHAGDVPEADRNRKGDLHPLRADDPADAAHGAGKRQGRSLEPQDDHRRLGPSARRWRAPRSPAAWTSSPPMASRSRAPC